MLIADLNGTSNLSIFIVDKMEQWIIVKDKLAPMIKVVADIAFKDSETVESLQYYIQNNIKRNNSDFALWVTLDRKTRRIENYAVTCMVSEKDTNKKICLIYNLYVNPKNFLSMIHDGSRYIEIWCKTHGGDKIKLVASHDIDRLTSLFERRNFKPVQVILEKEI